MPVLQCKVSAAVGGYDDGMMFYIFECLTDGETKLFRTMKEAKDHGVKHLTYNGNFHNVKVYEEKVVLHR